MKFSGVWLPLITPFANDTFDEVGLAKLIELYIECGISGLVALAMTGEVPTIGDGGFLAPCAHRDQGFYYDPRRREKERRCRCAFAPGKSCLSSPTLFLKPQLILQIVQLIAAQRIRRVRDIGLLLVEQVRGVRQ